LSSAPCFVARSSEGFWWHIIHSSYLSLSFVDLSIARTCAIGCSTQRHVSWGTERLIHDIRYINPAANKHPTYLLEVSNMQTSSLFHHQNPDYFSTHNTTSAVHSQPQRTAIVLHLSSGQSDTPSSPHYSCRSKLRQSGQVHRKKR
jgi:hypothetical protein